MNPLSEQDIDRLVKLLGLLSSDQAGERATAGEMAWRFIKQRGLTWDEVLRPKVPAVTAQRSNRPSPATPNSWRETVTRCPRLDGETAALTAWERQFLVALTRRRFPPTPKQLGILDQIQLKIGQPPW